ncbi:MAG: carboxylesterase/lipase family protein [Nocardioides sp.]|uniref:carboxylesterase/lipase family protein n=1 Tax=Nocardioides sp. TaxID=35761 RepID=UPI003D6AF35A
MNVKTLGSGKYVARAGALATCMGLVLSGLQGISSPSTANTDPDQRVVRTDQGLVRGVAEQQNLLFQGIPYAQPPTGDLRWQPPRHPRRWSGVREASRPGPACAQLGDDGEVLKGSSEDCLYLNVTTPRSSTHSTHERRPVIVYLHGGAFSSGAGSDFDARRMAAAGDAVVVTVNSRLGVFGFFGHRDLPDSGTYGLADQQAALRWVRSNARAFGGDPGRVTLMGESSGGASACAQLTSPTAAGLFHRAIIHSGACTQRWPRNVMWPGAGETEYWAARADVQDRGTAAAKDLDCVGAGALRCLRERVEPAQLLALNGQFTQPAYDTTLLPLDPVRALRGGRFHRVPVLQGNTRDEHRLFGSLFEAEQPIDDARYRNLLTESFGAAAADRIHAQYPPSRYRGQAKHPASLAWAAVGTDVGWVCPTVSANRMLAGRVPVYSFEFADPDVPANFWEFPEGFPPGAYHGSELPMLFDLGDSYASLSKQQKALSTTMIKYWTGFARSGNPNAHDLARWPRLPRLPVAGAGPRTLSLDSGPGGITRVDLEADHRCAFWESVAAEQRPPR